MSDEQRDAGAGATTPVREPFPPVAGGYPFPELELEVLEQWRRDDVFRRSVEQPAPRGHWVLYEGPPTANNVPHVGHVVTRVVKDLFPRYRTMRGWRVLRKAGWDTHGLPVEIEVEKRLGFSGKQQIEAYGIAAFNRECLQSVHTYEKQWRAMTERVGYWTDLDDAYFTYSNEYVESVWWALSELWKKGLLRQGYKIQPYCPRCGTTLSSHEVAQNYKQAEDPSVWVLFPVRPGQQLQAAEGGAWRVPEGLAVVAWTTTPWTLLAHVGLAVAPDMVYRVVERPDSPGQLLLFAEGLQTPVPLVVAREGRRQQLDLRELPAVARFRGAELEGLRYERPFTTQQPDRIPGPPRWLEEPPSDAHGWRVVLGDYVTPSEGTGIVHTAPPFGEDDHATGESYGLPFFVTIDPSGRIAAKPGIEPFAGVWFKEADPSITADLKRRGLLLHGARYRHNYPFCWRCDRPLLYYATESWFVTVTAAKERLVALNREIDWHPPHVGEGRFGNWLENVVDWALSRRRYWGTPLPVWTCDGCEERAVPGSYRELFALAGRELPADPYDRRQLDPHRPFIDEVAWPCAGCGGTMRRVEEVIDAWFDSGAMPFAQHHYPFAHRELFERQFPADLISEAVDQTRGWFYTLHVLGALLFDSVAYRACVVLGHVNDEQGRKMSKRLGNVVEPMAVVEEAGADALRWYFYVANPEQPSRFSAPLVREAAQRFLLPLWNALSFFTIYANIDDWHPGESAEVPLGARTDLDKWILLRLDSLVEQTSLHLDSLSIAGAAREIESFVDDLTNWYIRRSRDRFWAARDGGGADKESAYQTLYAVLTTLARLLAPFTPFLAEVLHRQLVRSQRQDAADSVHLETWPDPAGHREELGADALALVAGMSLAQRIVSLGRTARSGHDLKTRQPLARITLVGRFDSAMQVHLQRFGDLVRDELNVKEVKLAETRSTFVDHQVRPNFRVLGKRLGPLMPAVKAALERADGDRLAATLDSAGAIELQVEGQAIRLEPHEIAVRIVEKPGMATAADDQLLVALDTHLTPELVAEGLAREVVHRIQQARKEAKLDYADRIRVRYRAAPELAAAIAAHRDTIAGETLALELAPAADGAGLAEAPVEGMDFAFSIDPHPTG
ncbi:MAG TPA: isoleucine--tRNA ligase [Thermoanaerobaculia bacterium]|nr:isoleucine--tRNA ligase [Thermoanaerobaculia bacterium]